MTRIARLKRSALDSCRWRGHQMTPFKLYSDTICAVGVSHCRVCGREVYIDTLPAPNGINIGGEAVAVNCWKGH